MSKVECDLDSTVGAMLQLLPEPALLVCGDGLIMAANTSAAELLGGSCLDLSGRPLEALLWDSAEKVRSYLGSCASSRHPVPVSLRWRNGSEHGLETCCQGAMLQPRLDTSPALLLLRCQPKLQSDSQVLLLNEKIQALSREVVERRRVEQSLRQAQALLAGQARVLEMLATGKDLAAVLLALTRLVEQQMPDMLTSILLADEESKRLHHGAAPSLSPAYVQAIDGLAIGPAAGSCGAAAYRGERVIVEDIGSDPLWADYRHLALGHGLAACWAQPIFASKGGVLGTVAAYCPVAPRRPTAEELILLETTARLAGLAIERHRSDAELRLAKELAERSVTEAERAAQQAKAASDAKDHFLAVLSHELRTPLTPVLAVVSSLENQDFPLQIHEDIAMVRRSVELETRLIDDLLDLTRVERGKLELSVHPISAHAKLLNVVTLCRSEAEAKRLRIEIELKAAQHYVMGDSARLQQVFWNLLRNAIKFTPEGGSVTIRSSNDEPGQLRIEMTDTGIGIEPDLLPRICNPFEQGEKAITRRFGGLGLGLAIAKTIVDLHGGTLVPASEGKGRGATFTVHLHTIPAPQPASAVPHPTPRYTSSARILLVEDHVDTARAMSRLLEQVGHRVITANCVAGALQVAAAESFDLLISDIGLPDGSGLDLIRQLRQLYPVPGIVLSGFGMEEDITKSKAAGFAEHLTKPVDLRQLEAAIGRILAPART